jgi:hypothetical protein
MAKIDLTGQVFGYLRVIEHWGVIRVGYDGQPKQVWTCECVCGTQLEIQGQSLRSGNTRSCGCLGNHDRQYPMSREEKIWRAMIYRCHHPNSRDYHKYGGRGIVVCCRWRDSFGVFLRDMGGCPSKRHSIDRIEGNRGYVPGNCRWATPVEQGRNRRDYHGFKVKVQSCHDAPGISRQSN